MPALPDYVTKKGKKYGVAWHGVPVPADAPYWAYQFDVLKPNGKPRALDYLVRKDAHPKQKDADAYLLTEPLADLHRTLEASNDDDYLPPRRDFIMFP